MLPDFNMIIHKFPREDITIIPISDVHLGAPECMEQEFIKFIDKIKDEPNVYLVLGGDLINNATRSSVSNIFEERYRPSDQKKMMSQILAPVAHKILAAVSGNHERRSGSRDADDDPTYDILCKLDREDVYRENMAFVKLQFGDIDGNGATNPTYMLVVSHGAAGGQFTSGAVLKNERYGYAVDGMDALITGHTHKPYTSVHGKIYIDKRNNKVTVKPFKVISMTSWMEYGGYAAQKMLLPSAHALHTITLCGDHKEMIVTM